MAITWGAKKPRSVRKPRKAMPSWGAKKPRSVVKKVASLAKQVNKLTKISYDKVDLRMGTITSAAVDAPVYQYAICNGMYSWAPTFNENTSDIFNVSKIYVNSYNLDVRIDQASEASTITYTTFIVSLKDQGADVATLDPATGKLVLVEGTHYVQLPTAGRVLLNKDFFTVHQMKRFFMGGQTSTSQGSISTKNLSFKIVPKQRLIENPRGNIFATSAANGLTYPRDPSQNYFFLAFNDNSAVDLEANAIHIGGLASVAIPS